MSKELLEKTNRAIKFAIEKARRERNEKDRRYIVSHIGGDLVRILTPLLKQIAANSMLTKEDIKQIVKEIKVEAPVVNVAPPVVNVQTPKAEVKVEIPKIKIPPINVPEPRVTVNVPPIDLPKEMEVKGMKGFIKTLGSFLKKKPEAPMGAIDQEHPLNVILTDEKGKPYRALTKTIGSGGGGIVSTKPTEEVPVGYEQLAVTNGAAIPLASIPAKANKAYINVEDAQMRYKTDGNDPSATAGIKAFIGTMITLSSRQAITMFRSIGLSATNTELNINYYEVKP